MKIKRIIATILAFALLFSNTANATYNKEDNIIAKKTVHTISPGLTYSSSVELFGGERQEIFSFEYSPQSSTKIVPAYGQYIYGFNSVGSLISSYDGEGRVVGGINTDFYITSTGIPLSCLVSEKEVISTCDNRPAIGFDENGNGIIGYPKISAKIYSDERELPVAHINKVPAIWGMYLVTDKFYKTTKSSIDSIEIVFRPFDKEQTYLNFEEKSDTGDSDNLENKSDDLYIDKTYNDNESSDDDNNEEAPENNDILAYSDAVNDESSDYESENGDLAENSTDDINNDVVYKDAEDKNVILEKYVFTSQNAEIGSEIDVVITDIFDGVQNSEIPEDSFVLCVPKEQFGYKVDGLKIGDEFKFNISADELFLGCTSIFGAGSIILKNGEFVEQNNDSIYYAKNPRTAAGIKPDGSVIFICIDGRRKGESEGVTIRELSDYLLDLGCSYAINFDGGGSTTFYAADIGESLANLKNTPSAGAERRVADGMIFVNTAEPNAIAEYAALYPGEFMVYYKEVEELIYGDLKFADGNLYPVETPNGEIYYRVDAEFGEIVDNIFIPSGITGKAEIFAGILSNVSLKEFSVGHINITDCVNKIEFAAESTQLSPFDTGTYLEVNAYLDTIPVTISPYSIDWNIAIEEYNELGEKVYKNVGTEYALIDAEKMLFVPFVKGEKYILTASLGDFSQELEITVDAFPYTDMFGHWAAQTSYEMFKNELITGELNDKNVRIFSPDRNMTTAEFCVVLARVMGLNINNVEQSVFDSNDVSMQESEDYYYLNTDNVPQWAKPYVTALYENGLLTHLVTNDGEGKLSINANGFITRNDIIRVLGSLIDADVAIDSDILLQYSDFVPENEDDLLYFYKTITSGIINGYDDGTIRQYSNLTRAEAATVLSRFYNLYNQATKSE